MSTTYNEVEAREQTDRDSVTIECPNAKKCERVRHALERAGFHVDGAGNGGKPGEVARIRLDIPLTSREIEILQALCNHESQAQVAVALAMKENAVVRHLSQIRDKLAVESTAQAIAIGFRLGLLH